jgi:hypothetical protein
MSLTMSRGRSASAIGEDARSEARDSRGRSPGITGLAIVRGSSTAGGAGDGAPTGSGCSGASVARARAGSMASATASAVASKIAAQSSEGALMRRVPPERPSASTREMRAEMPFAARRRVTAMRRREVASNGGRAPTPSLRATASRSASSDRQDSESATTRRRATGRVGLPPAARPVAAERRTAISASAHANG